MRADRVRGWAGCVFLVLCILLGGASHWRAGVAANGLLQAIAVGLIVFSVATRRSAPYPDGVGALLLIGGAWLLLNLLYLVPVPPDVWTSLPGRGPVAQGMAMLGVEAGSQPVSLAPNNSINSLLRLLPPTALFLLTVQMSNRERRRLAVTAIAAAAVAILLGIAQLAGGPSSSLRFYEVTNPGMAVGFFANGNHQATLLLCALAFAGFLIGRGATRAKGTRDRSRLIMGVMIALFIAVGIGIVGSLAGYGLLIPVTAGVVLIYRKAAKGKIGWVWGGAAAALLVAGVGLGIAGPLSQENLSSQLGETPTSRRVIAGTTMEAIGAHFPVGSGLGTFGAVYRTFESPYRTTTDFVNHAHNDYLEVALETGVAGILLILAFLLWFAFAARRAWRNDQEGGNLARAATLAIGAVLLHSLVDYPLRTSAIAAIFAMSCAMLLAPRLRQSSRRTAPEAGSDLRHMEAD